MEQNTTIYKQNKGLFVFDTVFIKTIIWFTLSGSPDNGPDKDSIENKRKDFGSLTLFISMQKLFFLGTTF
jgi:hypothetical protein